MGRKLVILCVALTSLLSAYSGLGSLLTLGSDLVERTPISIAATGPDIGPPDGPPGPTPDGQSRGG